MLVDTTSGDFNILFLIFIQLVGEWGDNLILRSYFSDGLETPTRFLATYPCNAFLDSWIDSIGTPS